MTKWHNTKLPEWLSVETARTIAIGAQPHPTEGSPVVRGRVAREPRKPHGYCETPTFKAHARRDCFGPHVEVQWFTGDRSRGNKWTLKLPAEQLLELAEWVVSQESQRQAWWEWLKSSEEAIKREARESGVQLDIYDTFKIRDEITKHKERLISPAEIIDFSSPKQRK